MDRSTSITAYSRGPILSRIADSDFYERGPAQPETIIATTSKTFTQEKSAHVDRRGARIIDWMVRRLLFMNRRDQEWKIYYGADFPRLLQTFPVPAVALDLVEGALSLPVRAWASGQADKASPKEFGQGQTRLGSIFGTVDGHATDRLTATVGLQLYRGREGCLQATS